MGNLVVEEPLTCRILNLNPTYHHPKPTWGLFDFMIIGKNH